MRRTVLFLTMSAVLFAGTALAEPGPNSGGPGSPGASYMRVTATQPVALENGFRMMFRLLATGKSEMPIAAALDGTNVFEWIAYTSRGARCSVSKYNFKGLGAGHLSELDKKTSSQWSINPARPLIVVADFTCEGRIAKGDGATVQVKFYLFDGDKWVPADYTFEGATVTAP